MVRPYSNDLRERVARSVLSGRSARETARLFGVSVASAVKWSQRLRATGSAASVRVLAVELKDRGFEVSHSTVWSLRTRPASASKETLFAVEQLRPATRAGSLPG